MTPRKKPLIYGPDGRPLVRVNDRLAPKPRASARLEGWVSWGLIDRKGNKVRGGEQHNLILDTFLERIAVGWLYVPTSFFSHFAVGTGSTPPDVTDTALDNEVGRTSALIGSSTPQTANGVWDLILEREFDFAVGNGNLTEFGFSYGVSSPMLVRELFRDGGGNPVTITKTSDYKLRIKYTLTVTLTPVTETAASFPITGIGTINGTVAWHGGTPTLDASPISLFSSVANGGIVGGIYPTNAPPVGYNAHVSSTARTNLVAPPSYVPGSHTRTSGAAILGTSDWNTGAGEYTCIAASVGPYTYRGTWVFIIAPGDRFGKDSFHTLTFDDLLTVSWGRA